MKRLLERLDRLQQRHPWLALPFAVFKRFGEHGGGRLVTTISYWSFFSIFPLLLAFVSVLNLVLEDDPETRQDLVEGALGQVPVLGTQLAESDSALGGSALTVAVGIALAVWSGLAAALALETALDEVWDTPMFERPNGVVQRVRGLAFLLILAIGLSASTLTISATETISRGIATQIGAIVVTFVVDVVILLATYRMLTSGRNAVRRLLTGTLIAAAVLVVLQFVGRWVVTSYISGASDTYGTFAVVIALLSWFFLVSRVVLLGAELNAVLVHELWPRSLAATSPVTDGDRRAVHYDARRVQRDRRIGVAVSLDGDEAQPVAEPEAAVRAGGS